MVARIDTTGRGTEVTTTTSSASTDTSYVTVYMEGYYDKSDYDVGMFEDYEERRIDKQEKRYAAKNYKSRAPKVFMKKQEMRIKRFKQKIR